MPLNRFRRFWRDLWGTRIEDRNKINKLEQNVRELNERLHKYEAASPPPIVIERLHVERLIIESLEYSNNIANLGIKELSGSLNIGVTYGPSKKPVAMVPCGRSAAGPAKQKTSPSNIPPGPACHIRSKPPF